VLLNDRGSFAVPRVVAAVESSGGMVEIVARVSAGKSCSTCWERNP
jgi:hypothetical protein